MRKLATIRKIKDIQPIEGADAIEVLQIDGWTVVGKKNEFKVDDLCVYFEIDSILPECDEFEFLRKNKFRIKTIRLRGQLSQGIAFPVSVLSNGVMSGGYHYNPSDNIIFRRDGEVFPIEEGLDLTELIGVEKYEAPIPAQLAGVTRGGFPSRIPKSDEERVQNLEGPLLKILDDDIHYIASEKLDGSSTTYLLIDNEFHVCSRNLDLKETEGNSLWRVAREDKIEEKMREYAEKMGIKEFGIQGELVGEGIQKNKYKLKGQHFFIYNMFDIDNQRYFTWDEEWDFIGQTNLKYVPIIDFHFKLNTLSKDNFVNELLQYAEGESKLCQTQREGIVFKSKIHTNVFRLSSFGKISFKAISNKFLLKHGDE